MEELIAKALSTLTVGGVGIWSGVAMFAMYMLRDYRENQKLSTEDRQARREGYAAQVTQLMGENRSLRGDLSRMATENTEYRELCHKETDELRGMIVKQEGEIAGWKRRVDTMAITIAQIKATVTSDSQIATLIDKLQDIPR